MSQQQPSEHSLQAAEPVEVESNVTKAAKAAKVKAEPPKQVPTVGRIVLYNYPGKKIAGIVCEVFDATTVALRLQLPPSLNHLSDALIESCVEGESDGTWSWPARL